MSDSAVFHSAYYVMRKIDSPDEVFTLQDTGAVDFTKPSTVAYPIGLADFFIHPELVKYLDQQHTNPNFAVQISPIFPYKFELNLLDYDDKAVDEWFDGVIRFRGGTLSLLSNSTFITVFGVHHEQQIERAVETYNAIVGGGFTETFSFIATIGQITNEHHFADIIGTALAHRLTKTVILQAKVWWLYRITLYLMQ